VSTPPPKPVSAFIDGMNAIDIEAFLAPLADDALVNDRHRQFWGKSAIRQWAEAEIIGDSVTLKPTDVREHYGEFIVTGAVDGTFDKTGLPPVLTLAFYFSVCEDRIVQIIILPIAGRALEAGA
jgi:hypothetical protein